MSRFSFFVTNMSGASTVGARRLELPGVTNGVRINKARLTMQSQSYSTDTDDNFPLATLLIYSQLLDGGLHFASEKGFLFSLNNDFVITKFLDSLGNNRTEWAARQPLWVDVNAISPRSTLSLYSALAPKADVLLELDYEDISLSESEVVRLGYY